MGGERLRKRNSSKGKQEKKKMGLIRGSEKKPLPMVNKE